MKILIFALFIAGAGYFVKTRLLKPHGDTIEGRWEVVSWPEGWKAVPGSNVTITSNEIKIIVGVLPMAKYHYEIDPDAGTLDATKQSGGHSVQQLAVFQREGDTLTLCVGAEGKARPASIDSTGDGAMRWVLREKK
ncbi:MAG TPA: hypothetical protein VG796_14395 [Verrucomicrobiales bacterium]|jgi:hypothetical protein|nr:hypothetical protein [Verrucomicrobiales bacterium]